MVILLINAKKLPLQTENNITVLRCIPIFAEVLTETCSEFQDLVEGGESRCVVWSFLL